MVKKVSKIQEPDEEELKNKRRAIEEIQLRKLMRENRMMRNAKVKDTLVERQLNVTHALKLERNSLVNNLNVMTSLRRCLLDNEQTQWIAALFEESDQLDEEIAEEKKYLEDLNAKIRADSTALDRLKKEKKEMIGRLQSDNLVKEETEKADRCLHGWKIRLHAEQQELSKTTTENARLREHINTKLREKENFNRLFDELMRKLKKGKEIMTDIVEQAKSQFQRKDEIAYKIEALKDRDKADLAKKMEEMQEMEIRLYEDKKLAAFKHKLHMVRMRMVGNVRQSTKERETRQKMTLKLQKYQEFMDSLRDAVELDTADEICEMIRREDAAIYSLFIFNNEIRDELEFKIQKVAELMRKVDEEEANAEDLHAMEMKIRDNLRLKLSTLEARVIDKKEQCDANERLFDRLLSKIQVLFDLMHCDPSPLYELLGDKKRVTEFNYKLYLGLVESELMFLLDLAELHFPAPSKPKLQTMMVSAMSVALTRTCTVSPSTISNIVLDKKVITRPCTECDPSLWKRF